MPSAAAPRGPGAVKAHGAVYTPPYIVRHLVQQALGPLLETPLHRLGARAIQPIRVLDPACGDGAFLRGAYQYLLDRHRDACLAEGLDSHREDLREHPTGHFELTAARRVGLLLTHLYGVDIDPRALDEARRSLADMALGEGRCPAAELPHLRKRLLTGLKENLLCGDALLDENPWETSKKGGAPSLPKRRPHALEGSLPRRAPGRRVCFDAVIGNPPYGAHLTARARALLAERFTEQSGRLETYLLFLEHSIKALLTEGGQLSMLLPSAWLHNLLQGKIRRYLFSHTAVREIVCFNYPVFPGLVVDTMALTLQKAPPDGRPARVISVDTQDAFLRLPSPGPGARYVEADPMRWRGRDGAPVNVLATPEEEALARRCAASGPLLGELCHIHVGIKPYQRGKGTPPQTAATVARRPFDADRPLDDAYRPCLRGADITRYRIAPLKARFLRYGPWLAEPRPAARFDAPAKILVRQTGDRIIAALDAEQRLCLNNLHVVAPREGRDVPSIHYLLGVLNSTLMSWYFRFMNPEVGEALAEVKRQHVASLPIRAIDPRRPADRALHDELAGAVKEVLSSRQGAAAEGPRRGPAPSSRRRGPDDERLREQCLRMDRLVYELYSLTEAEIHLIEAAGPHPSL